MSENVTVTEAAKGLSTWVIPAITTGFFTILGTIIAYYFSLRRDKRQEKDKRIQENMETHFKDIKNRIADRISSMSRDLCIAHYRLLFPGVSPVSENYGFLEEKEEYSSFKIHFKDYFEEWEKLLRGALNTSHFGCNHARKRRFVGSISRSA